MKQHEIEALLDKIRKSSKEIPIPQRLEPEYIMERVNMKNKYKWKKAIPYGVIVAAGILTVAGVGQLKEAGISNMIPIQETTELGTEAEDILEENVEGATEYIAESYDDIYKKIKEFKSEQQKKQLSIMPGGGREGGIAGVMVEETMGFVEDAVLADSMEMADGAKFSDTNTQVEGVDEGDVVKTDGSYFYIMSPEAGRIQMVQVDGSVLKKNGVIEDSSTTTEAKRIQEFYIHENRLSVIRQSYQYYNDGAAVYDMCGYAYQGKGITYLETYDISDKNSPKLLGTVTQDGIYKNSRRVDDYVYLFTNYSADDIKKEKDIETYVPMINNKVLSYKDIYLPEQINSSQYMVISSVNMQKPETTVTEKAVMADGEHFYVSGENIYIGSRKYDFKASQYDYTEILKLSYNKGRIMFKAHGTIDGYLNNQFSMDEYKGKLRVVTTLSHQAGNSTNSLIVLDEALKTIGLIEDLAPGEQIYSARFMGDIGYFVTFRNMDPLFSVDLSDPFNPKILGELKITGFSEYLHPYQEELLLGIGREIDPDTGNFKGLKLSMFDTSNPRNVTESKKQVEKTYEYSPAWYNHKSVTISSAKNLIGFSVEEYDSNSRNWSSKYVVYSYHEQDGFKKMMTHELDEQYSYDNVRGIYIDSWFYVVESETITVFSLKDFSKAGQIKY